MRIRKIAISTGGGDAPGLNAVIRAVVFAAQRRGWECYGIRNGYDGLMEPERFEGMGGGLILLNQHNVRGITHLGGSILGTTNRGNPLKYPFPDGKGGFIEKDRGDELVAKFQKQEFDALVAIGGDGSLAIAHTLSERGLNVVGVPKTIDNDIDKTFVTFGFDTAVSFATDCIGRLHSTAEAHSRIMVVEVMGRYAGWIALNSGVAAAADIILIPEIPYVIDQIVHALETREKQEKHYSIIVVAEGARARDGTLSVVEKKIGQAERLGGIGNELSKQLSERLPKKEIRVVVLGHLLRGGSPTTFDRLSGLRFGAAAVRAIESGKFGMMVALNPPAVDYISLKDVTRRMKCVTLDNDTILTARDLDICFGD